MTEHTKQWRLPDELYDTCVREIYRAANGKVSWKDTCEHLCLAFDLSGLQIVGLDKRNSALLFHWEGGCFSARGAIEYISKFHRINPRIQLALHLAPEAWLHDHLVFSDTFVAENEFFRDFAIPYRARYVSTTKLIDEQGEVILLAAMRPAESSPLTAIEVKEFSRLRKHLSEALRIYRDLHVKVSTTASSHAMLDSLSHAVVVTDEMRRVLYENTAAKRLLSGNGVFVRDATTAIRLFALNDEVEDMRLTALMHSLSLPGTGASGPTGNAFVSRIGTSEDQENLIILGRAFRVEVMEENPGAPTRAGRGNANGLVQFMLIVHPIRAKTDLDPMIIGNLFQLSPAEAEVATALANGEKPEEIASRRGVSLHTIRTQIRAVYTKLKVTRQAELARLLAEIPRLE